MNTEQKTIREWFLEAKEQGHEWADKALANDKSGPDEFAPWLQFALRGGFVWSEAPEGFHFWNNIYRSL